MFENYTLQRILHQCSVHRFYPLCSITTSDRAKRQAHHPHEVQQDHQAPNIIHEHVYIVGKVNLKF